MAYNIPYFEDEKTKDKIRMVLFITMFIFFVVGLILFTVGYTQELETLKIISFGFFGSVGICFMILVSLCEEM